MMAIQESERKVVVIAAPTTAIMTIFIRLS